MTLESRLVSIMTLESRHLRLVSTPPCFSPGVCLGCQREQRERNNSLDEISAGEPLTWRRPSSREGRGHWRRRRSAVGNTWAGCFFPWHGRSPVSHPTRDVPFPPRRSGEHRKGTIPARPYATRTNGEWGYSTRRLCWATCAQGRCHPKEALYSPTFTVIY